MAATGVHPILYTPGNLTTLPIDIDQFWCAAAITGIVTAPVGMEPAGILATVSVRALPVDSHGVPLPGQPPFTIGAVSGWVLRGNGMPQRVRLSGQVMQFATPFEFYTFTLVLQHPPGAMLGAEDFFVVSIVELDGPSAMLGGGGAPSVQAQQQNPDDTTGSFGPHRVL